MIPAAKHFDPIIGIDFHIIQPPPPAPAPIPMPHPHVGIMMDPFDYVPLLGSTVTIFGLHRVQAGSAGQQIPPSHMPSGGVFIKPPENESEVFMGSMTVSIDGDAGTYLGQPSLSCQDVGMKAPPRGDKPGKTHGMVLPTTTVLAIPLPVTYGGPPTISLMSLGMRAAMAGAMKGLGKLKKKWKKLKKTKKVKKADNAKKCEGLCPVNIITGEQFDTFLDAAGPPDALFRWQRHYTTRRRDEIRALGSGFRHSYEHELELSPQGWRYERWDGEVKLFDALTAFGSSRSHEYRLHRTRAGRLELSRGHDPLLIFSILPGGERARLRGMRLGLRQLDFDYEDGHLVAITETGMLGDQARYRLSYNEQGHLLEVRRESPHPKVLARYRYDGRGCLIEAEDAEGGRQQFEYDARRLMVKMRHPSAYTYWWRYDEDGRCVEGAGEDGLWQGKLAYFPHKRETHLEEAGGLWIYRYDENGTLTERVAPDGGMLTRELGEDGRVVREIDSGGRQLHWLYDDTAAHHARRTDARVEVPPEVDLPEIPNLMRLEAPTTSRGWSYGTLVDDIPSFATVTLDGWLRGVPAPCWARLVETIDVDRLRNRSTRDARTRQYDELGRVVLEIDADGHQQAWRYDASGNEVWHRDRDGLEVQTRITRWNLLGAKINALGPVFHYAYNDQERITKVVDGGGNATEYLRDNKHRIVAVVSNGAPIESYVYDDGDRLLEKRDAAGHALLELSYDERCWLSEAKYADGGWIRLSYDAEARVTAASTHQHDVLIDRDALGDIVADTVDGEGVVHQREAPGTTSVWFGKFRSHVERVGNGRWRFVDATGGEHRLLANRDGVVIREHANGLRVVSRYHPTGRCEGTFAYRQKRDGDWFHWGARYRYSPEGDLLEVADSVRGTTRYTVDAMHRLAAEDGPAGSFQYAYDAAGSLIAKPALENAWVTENKLRSANGERFAYDDRQSMCRREHTDGEVTHYVYDSFDMLSHVTDSMRHWTASYDAIGRRLGCGTGAAQRRFFWDGERLGAEIDGQGRVRLYTYADDDARVPLFFVDYESVDATPESGEVYVVVTDQVGCPSFVLDSDGRIVWWAHRAAPYGAITIDSSATIELNLRWPGHYQDPETGLHYNRFRYYDPTLGRYLQRDPLGQAGGINVYAYAPNPLVQVDVLGLDHRGGTKGNNKSGGKGPTAEGPPEKVTWKERPTTKTSGMLDEHIEAICEVADLETRIAMFRNVEATCKRRLKEGASTKPMPIKGKSATRPPCIDGYIPVDQRFCKLRDSPKPAQFDRISELNELNKKALGDDYYEFMKEPSPGWWKPHKGTNPPPPEPYAYRKPILNTDDPPPAFYDVLADKQGRPITGDYDMLAVGHPRGVDPGSPGKYDKNTGVSTPDEKSIVGKVDEATREPGKNGRQFVWHGPETNNPNPEPLDAHVPVTACLPDGTHRVLESEEEMFDFYNEAADNGYKIPIGKGWGWEQNPDTGRVTRLSDGPAKPKEEAFVKRPPVPESDPSLATLTYEYGKNGGG